MEDKDFVVHEHYAPVQPSYRALPVYWKDAVLPTPTRSGAAAQKQAVINRVGRRTPAICNDQGNFHDFVHHVIKQCQKRLGVRAIPANTDFWSMQAFEEWLEATHYSGPRKEQLRKIRRTMPDFPSSKLLKQWARNKCHVKLEGYPQYKAPRGIMSRTDYVKVWIGPLIKKIESLVYELPEFIKHVKAHERPSYLRDRMVRAGCDYGETDYTSFEGAIRDKIQGCCEFEMMRYICRLCPAALRRVKQFEAMCSGINVMSYTDITARIKGRRMSGEMTTSLANGWTNLMLATFVLRHITTDIPIVVEGDDGLVTIPKGNRGVFNATAFAKLGFIIKIDWHPDLESSGFCGIVCDPTQGAIITDPISAIASFGWCGGAALRSNYKTQLGLLRAKALSLAYQYPGSPVLAALARLGVRLSHGYAIDAVENPFLNGWEKDILVDAERVVTNEILNRPVAMGTRKVMERKYGVSVDDQIKTEKYLDSIKDFGELSMPWLSGYATPEMRDAASYFVRSYPAGTPWYMVARALN